MNPEYDEKIFYVGEKNEKRKENMSKNINTNDTIMCYNHIHHHHENDVDSRGKAFIFGIILNALFVLIEFGVGITYHSVALISDAGHNLGDVASLVLALMAFHLAKKETNDRFTYGYQKSTILVSLVNAVLLMIAVVFIFYDAIQSISAPQSIDGQIIFIVAFIGVVVNGLTAWLFLKDKNNDLNVKGAFLHMMADTIVSLGVIVSGLLIVWTGWNIIDPIIGVIIAIIIIISTWNLLKESLRLTLDAVPEMINLNKISQCMQTCSGVLSIHHLHVWALSTTEIALTAHIVLEGVPDINAQEQIKNDIKQRLYHEGIKHITLEMESAASCCHEQEHSV